MSGGDAFFQVDGDMIVAPANPASNGIFFNGNSTSSIRIETTGKLDVHNATIKAYGITISGNYDQKTGSGTSSVSFHDITTSATGGAINRIDYGTLEISNQTVASFTDNKASQGAAIYGRYSSLTFTNNKLLAFENNVATNKTGNGGAIYGQTTTLIVTNNDVARFSGNSATGGTGGALRMNGSPEGTTLSNNGVLEFSDNTAKQGGAAYFTTVLFDHNTILDFSRNSSSSYGGALYINTKGTISNSGLVRFNDNKAQNSLGYNQAGGAIYNNKSLTISSNDVVEFRNNISNYALYNKGTATFDANGDLCFIGNEGGAIFSGSTGNYINIKNHTGIVEFSSNSASIDGGAITGGSVSLTGNKEIYFTNNTAANRGGAIYNSKLTISGNDKVVFRGNAEIDANGNTLLRSIYNLSETLHLSATKATDSITFYDTVYAGGSVELNNNSAGRITFSGKYTAADLAAYGSSTGADALRDSRTSIFTQSLSLGGGLLEVADEAILQTSTLTVYNGATVELNSGHISGTLALTAGASLNVSGVSSISSACKLSGAALNVVLGADNLNTAALTAGSVSGLGSCQFTLNSADLVDGKYFILEAVSGTGATIAGVEGLSWEGNKLYLTVSGSDNTWHVRDNFSYSVAVDNSGSKDISLDGGTMRLTKNLSAGVSLSSTADSTLELGSGVELKASSLSNVEHTMTLSGTGIFNMGNSTTASVRFDDWQGNVQIGDGDGNYTSMSGLDLSKLSTTDSSIRLQGVQGSLASGRQTVEANLELAAGSGIAAMVISSANEGDSVHFMGKISSDGAVNLINDSKQTHSYIFSGDVSTWKGQIVSNAGTLNLTYAGDATQIATDVRAADTGSGSIVNLNIQNTADVIFSGAVEDAPTWNTQSNRTLNVTVDNQGNSTVFRQGIKADSIHLAQGSTMVALMDGNPDKIQAGRVTVTAHSAGAAELTAVDVTNAGLAHHTNNSNTRGSITNAAVVLGEEAAAAAMFAMPRAAVVPSETYTVSNVDFHNSTVTALQGTGVTMRNITMDATASLQGDASGNHLIQGTENSLTLAGNALLVDTDTATISYSSDQLAGFTLASGAALTLDATLLEIPTLTPGEYTVNILLAGFTALDGVPDISFSNAPWASTTTNTWVADSKGLVSSVTINTIPEPTTATLSLLALAALAARRRRK